MRTKLESRLSQLQAPNAPHDLKARCQQTIPADARLQPAKSRGFLPPLSAPKLGLATVVVATAIALAFWNARPIANKMAPANGNVAFAQTVEAMKNVTYAHIRGWKVNGNDGWRSTKRLNFQGEIDLSRGLYSEQSSRIAPKNELQLATGDSLFDRALVLPNGTTYTRDVKSTTLFIRSDSNIWPQMSKYFLELVAHHYSTNTGEKPKLISSAPGTWEGKAVNVYVFRAGWTEKPGDNDKNDATALETKYFVDPKTDLMEAQQSFAVLKDGTKIQQDQTEVDYTRPDASAFDPAQLKIGAQIEDNRKLK